MEALGELVITVLVYAVLFVALSLVAAFVANLVIPDTQISWTYGEWFNFSMVALMFVGGPSAVINKT